MSDNVKAAVVFGGLAALLLLLNSQAPPWTVGGPRAALEHPGAAGGHPGAGRSGDCGCGH